MEANQDAIILTWTIDDVEHIRPDLTKQQKREVLAIVERRFDAELGVNWDVLHTWAEHLFPEKLELRHLDEVEDWYEIMDTQDFDTENIPLQLRSQLPYYQWHVLDRDLPSVEVERKMYIARVKQYAVLRIVTREGKVAEETLVVVSDIESDKMKQFFRLRNFHEDLLGG